MPSARQYLERFDVAEYDLCRRLNRAAAQTWVRRLLQTASWLGDGKIWYAMMIGLWLRGGTAAATPVAAMAITGVAGVLIYQWLKTRLVRERPFIRHPHIVLALPPLDRYSFPSGHTLHAVSFTWQATAHYPELAWPLIPLTCAIALSRVVLGLHYPSDVLAGGLLGACLALAGRALAH